MVNSEINPSGMMCLATGLTDGFQCEIMRRLGKKCRKPSVASAAKGEHTTKDGLAYSNFWICIPALMYKIHNGTDEAITFDNTVAAQEKCDSFLARK